MVRDTGAGGGRFKTPSLRNVAVRRRFMHDGQFETLQEVVGFYSVGVQASPMLDSLLRAADGKPRRLRLTAVEETALIAFLGALTDSTFLTSSRFADPFARTSAAPTSNRVGISTARR